MKRRYSSESEAGVADFRQERRLMFGVRGNSRCFALLNR